MDQEYIQRIEKINKEMELWLTADDTWAQRVFPGLDGKIGIQLHHSAQLKQSIKTLVSPLEDVISRGGKRWRPLLMTLICETLGGADAALPLAPAVEFSHNASLIHDDIEDDSQERRGKPAIHKIYGLDTAINSGSFFYFLSSCCIENCALKNKEQIYKLWSEYMRRMHFGQAIDINWHRDVSAIPEIDEYFLMCRMKTGSLARFAAELGAHIAGVSASNSISESAVPQEIINKIGEAAYMMGVGFQILDDVKNLTTGIPGKRKGDDITEGKKSLPILLYLSKYPERRERVFYCFHVAKHEGTRAPEVEELIENMTAAGIFTEAEEIAATLLNEIKNVIYSNDLEKYVKNEDSKKLLDGFVKLIS